MKANFAKDTVERLRGIVQTFVKMNAMINARVKKVLKKVNVGWMLFLSMNFVGVAIIVDYNNIYYELVDDFSLNVTKFT